CFPFIFRGALDVGATTINEAMKLACVRALADLAMAEPSEVVAKAYGSEDAGFGPERIIPRPFDPRLILEIAPAVARAAMETGVATRPIADFEAYRQRLREFVFRSGLIMKPVFARARNEPRRVIYAEGEDERVLRAVQAALDEGLAQPILIGRPAVVESRIARLGLRLRPDHDVELVNPESDARYRDYWQIYHALMERKGVAPDIARTVMRTDPTAIAAVAIVRGDADAMICGVEGRYARHLRVIEDVIGRAPGVRTLGALSLLILSTGSYFLCDTYVNPDPTAEELVEMTVMAAREVERFGIVPKVALLSHSSFGSADTACAIKM